MREHFQVCVTFPKSLSVDAVEAVKPQPLTVFQFFFFFSLYDIQPSHSTPPFVLQGVGGGGDLGVMEGAT